VHSVGSNKKHDNIRMHGATVKIPLIYIQISIFSAKSPRPGQAVVKSSSKYGHFLPWK